MTPGSPCESPGLGSSAFARHYSRNHGCFLFLGVLRWFTSPGSPVHPMHSDARKGCSHPLGFPIRKSPDHNLLAAPRSLSQLTTSFFAFLRLGIHTHALSSLTIKSTSHTTLVDATFFDTLVCRATSFLHSRFHRTRRTRLRDSKMPVNILLSKIDENCFGSSVPGFQ